MIYEIYSQRKWEGSATEGAEKTEPLSPAFSKFNCGHFFQVIHPSSWQHLPVRS